MELNACQAIRAASGAKPSEESPFFTLFGRQELSESPARRTIGALVCRTVCRAARLTYATDSGYRRDDCSDRAAPRISRRSNLPATALRYIPANSSVAA